MTRDEVNTKVVDTVSRLLEKDATDVNSASNLVELGASSLDIVEIKSELENAFDLDEVSENELAQTATVGGVVDLIAKKLGLS